MTSELSPLPPGPADLAHPKRALARLALSAAGRELAELAAGHVPTVADGYGSAYDFVEYAARAVATAQELLERVVVYAREIGGSWQDIGEALSITADQAHERYSEAIARWEDALNRPWERSGRHILPRMPGGAVNPGESAADLDRWCVQHVPECSGTRDSARRNGVEDRMVSANLATHTILTELTREARYARYLSDRGGEATDAERQAFEVRKADVFGRAVPAQG